MKNRCRWSNLPSSTAHMASGSRQQRRWCWARRRASPHTQPPVPCWSEAALGALRKWETFLLVQTYYYKSISTYLSYHRTLSEHETVALSKYYSHVVKTANKLIGFTGWTFEYKSEKKLSIHYLIHLCVLIWNIVFCSGHHTIKKKYW